MNSFQLGAHYNQHIYKFSDDVVNGELVWLLIPFGFRGSNHLVFVDPRWSKQPIPLSFNIRGKRIIWPPVKHGWDRILANRFTCFPRYSHALWECFAEGNFVVSNQCSLFERIQSKHDLVFADKVSWHIITEYEWMSRLNWSQRRLIE